MSVTPDRRPGALQESEINWELETSDPVAPGDMRYVDQGGGQGSFRFHDKDGIYDPRLGGGLLGRTIFKVDGGMIYNNDGDVVIKVNE